MARSYQIFPIQIFPISRGSSGCGSWMRRKQLMAHTRMLSVGSTPGSTPRQYRDPGIAKFLMLLDAATHGESHSSRVGVAGSLRLSRAFINSEMSLINCCGSGSLLAASHNSCQVRVSADMVSPPEKANSRRPADHPLFCRGHCKRPSNLAQIEELQS